MCAPKSTAAATDAAVAISRSAGARSPMAALRNDLRDGPASSGYPSVASSGSAAIGERAPAGRDMATAASVAAAVLFGAHIVRVHNVPAMVDVVRVADALREQC